MIEINGKHFCENCFEETTSSACAHCGYDPSVTVSDPTMLTPGSVLLGKYIVGKVIGKGGFGVTYLAYDASAGRKAAIKEFFPYGVALRATGTSTVSVSSMDNANAFKLGAEKFYDEAKLVSRFNGNPNIVGVYEFFYENDTVYFAMEYLKGHTLKDHINEHGVISAPQALFIAQNVANALMAAHSSSVLHRDISPDNIILCDNGDIKLIDFGAARQVVAEHSQSFSVILKPGFAPLEQYQKKGKQGPWTDIYSLGATIYYALTGDIPEDPMTRLDDDSDFSSNRFGIDREMWDIIYKAAMLKIEDRYADIFEMKNALGKVSYQPEPIAVPNAVSEQKPEFRTALPYGMTRNDPAPQTVSQNTDVTPAYENTVQQGGNSSLPRSSLPQTGDFFRRHMRAVIAVSCIIVISIVSAVALPSILNNSHNDGISDNNIHNVENYPSDNYDADTLPVMDNADPPAVTAATTAAATEPYTPSVAIPSDKTYYSSMKDEYKPVYEAIYSGLENMQTEIKLPKHNLSDHGVNIIFYEVLYDNPQFCYVSYCDEGKTLTPGYIPDADFATLDIFASVILNDVGTSDKLSALCGIHDRLIESVTYVERYSTVTCTSAYGAIVDGAADDLGIAKAFCYYAQIMGLPCYVVDGTFNGELRAWCRVKLDGTWYNVDVYGDMIAESYIKEESLLKHDGYYHTYFLTNDTYIRYCGYVANSEYDFIWNGSYAADSQNANYYIEEGEKNLSFYYASADDAYNNLLSWAAERYNNGYSSSSIRVASFIIDDVWMKAKDSFINDLETKYGIHVTGGNAIYYTDKGTLESTLET